MSGNHTPPSLVPPTRSQPAKRWAQGSCTLPEPGGYYDGLFPEGQPQQNVFVSYFSPVQSFQFLIAYEVTVVTPSSSFPFYAPQNTSTRTQVQSFGYPVCNPYGLIRHEHTPKRSRIKRNARIMHYISHEGHTYMPIHLTGSTGKYQRCTIERLIHQHSTANASSLHRKCNTARRKYTGMTNQAAYSRRDRTHGLTPICAPPRTPQTCRPPSPLALQRSQQMPPMHRLSGSWSRPGTEWVPWHCRRSSKGISSERKPTEPR